MNDQVNKKEKATHTHWRAPGQSDFDESRMYDNFMFLVALQKIKDFITIF
jgi:hypothetical protein